MVGGQSAKQLWSLLGFSALVVCVFVLARGAGWFSARRSTVALQRQVIEQVDELGGHYYYDYQWIHPNSVGERLADRDSQEVSRHPLATLFGEDWFHDIFYITFAQIDAVSKSSPVAINKKIGNAQLDSLLQLPNLEWLALSGTAITDERLEQVAALPRLSRVWLSRTQITDQGMKSLSRCETLTHLAIEATATSDVGLAHIAQLPNLRFLSLGSPYISSDGLRRLSKTDSLQELYLDRLPVDERVLSSFEHLTQLRILSLKMTPVTDQGIQRLAGLKQLRQLYLDGTLITDAALDAASIWEDLENLSLAHTLISDAGLQKLERCTNLKSLDLTQTKCSLSGIEKLFVRQQTRTWADALSAVFPTRLNPQGEVISLDLSSLRLTDDDMRLLLPLQRLEWLMMPNNRLTDAGIEALMSAEWKRLSLIHLDNADISDASLELLGRLPALRTLHISNTKISAEAIEKLRTRKPGLRVYTEAPYQVKK